MKNRTAPALMLAATILLMTACGRLQGGPVGSIRWQEAQEIATEAYIYGYPLVTMEMTRRVMTNIVKANGQHAPMGEFARMRTYPNATFRDVTAPNADTLYVVAWLDVSHEAYIFTIPDSNGRYYLMPMLDAFSNVFQVPGKRTTGTKAQRYAITGPGWKGMVPGGITQLKAPTSLVWILGRIYCTGTPQDYRAVHAFQDQISLTPFHAYGRPYAPPNGTVDNNIDMSTPVREQVNQLDGVEFFRLMAELLKKNPPAGADAPIVNRMARIGIVPGHDFDISRLEPGPASVVRSVPKAALAKITGNRAGTTRNGWTMITRTGQYGTDYLLRATVSYFGLGANRPEDAVYPTSDRDAAGHPYSGEHKYAMHFPKGSLPPVNAFWSLTMYDEDYYFVENPLNRYTLSQRDKLKFNSDGSVDFYLQADSPGKDKESNWLPAPTDKFVLMMRLYWPKQQPPSVLNRTWNPPPVRRVE
jgi:hypothetical protein